MSYDDENEQISAEDIAQATGRSAQEESEAAQKSEYFGYQPMGRAASGERRAATQLWLISYSDFMTILLIFFLAMYGYTYLARATLIAKRSTTSRFSQFTQMMYGMKSELGPSMEIMEELEKVTIQLKDQVIFPSGSSRVSKEAVRTLDELSESLKLVEGRVIVEGHTDDVPVVGGKYPSNWELSAARAFSVIEYLTAKGVPAERLSAWGFGEFRPVAPNEDAAGRAKNRRIEIVVFRKGK